MRLRISEPGSLQEIGQTENVQLGEWNERIVANDHLVIGLWTLVEDAPYATEEGLYGGSIDASDADPR